MAKVQHIKRYNRVCAELHFDVCKKIGVNFVTELLSEYVPELVRGKFNK